MTHLSEDEHNTDWLKALEQDAGYCAELLNRIESLGIMACEHIRRGDFKAALEKLAQIGEGIRLVKNLVGVK